MVSREWGQLVAHDDSRVGLKLLVPIWLIYFLKMRMKIYL